MQSGDPTNTSTTSYPSTSPADAGIPPRRSSTSFQRVQVHPKSGMDTSRTGAWATDGDIEAKGGPLGESQGSSRTLKDSLSRAPSVTRHVRPSGRNIRMSVVLPTSALRAQIARRSMSWYSRLQSLFYRGKAYDTSTKSLKYTLMVMLYMSVVSVMSETVRFEQENTSWLEKPREVGVKTMEVIMFVVWGVELGLRLWTVPIIPLNADPTRARLKTLFHPSTLFDISLMAPVFVWMVMPHTVNIFSNEGWANLLRIYRCFRVLKFVRYAPTVYTLWQVLHMKSEELITTASVLGTIVLLLALLVFAFENPENEEKFPNLVVALWWAVITLTTVGYGDITPITPFGRLFGSVGAVIGIGLFTLPAGVIASGYLEQREAQKADFRRLLTHIADTKRKKVLNDGFQRLLTKGRLFANKLERSETMRTVGGDGSMFTKTNRLQLSARAVIAMHRLAAHDRGSGEPTLTTSELVSKSIEASRTGRFTEPDYPSAETLELRSRLAKRLLKLCGGNLEVAFSQVSGAYFVPRLGEDTEAPTRSDSLLSLPPAKS